MSNTVKILLHFTTAVVFGLLTIVPVAAQGLFTPVVNVNNRIVTQYELEQRILFMQTIQLTGNIEKDALENLIDERLQQDAAERLNITLSEEQLQAGLKQFASRGELEVEAFIQEIARADVSAETFRDFIGSQLLWREVVQNLYAARARITEDEIDRAVIATSSGGVQVLLRELILPNSPEIAAQTFALSARIQKISSTEEFESAARQFSVAPTGANGGRLDWLNLNTLPAGLAQVLLTLKPGEITDPITMQDAVAFFQMRGLREVAGQTRKNISVEYVTYLIPGGRSPEALSEAQQVRDQVDSCDDLYGVNFGQPDERLELTNLPVSQVSSDIALELAKLDDGEVSTSLTRNDGQTLVFLMLCSRTPELSEDVTRQDIRQNLFSQRLVSYAEAHMAQLRADATIILK